MRVLSHIFQIDQHLPFDDPAVRLLVERIAHDYLTHEFITKDRAQHEAYLMAQVGVLSR